VGKKNRNKQIKNVAAAAPAPKPLSFKAHLTAFILIGLVGFGVYANSFRNEFIWDDDVIIPPNEYIREFNIGKIFTTDVHHFSYQPSNFYRPLQMLSYAINYKIGKLDTFGYHIVNTLVHMFNAALIYLIILLMNDELSLTARKKWFWVALSGSLVWLVHPIHTQNTTYISGRADVLVAFFILSSFYAYAKFKKPLITSLLFIGALLSKESAIITPLLFILYNIIVRRERSCLAGRRARPLSTILRSYGSFFAILGVYAVLRLTVFNFPTAFTAEEIPGIIPRLLTGSRALFTILGVLAVPVNLSMLRNIPWEFSLLNAGVILSVIGIGCLIAGIFLMKRREPLVSFCLSWFFVTYLPVANIIPMNANMSEHWMYLPSIGIILLVVYLAWKYLLRQKEVYLIILSAILVAAYGFLLVQRNKDFKDQIVFFEKILKQFPTHARSHYNLGTAYGLKGENEKAKYHFQESLKSDPQFAPGYANLGLIYARENDLGKAIELYEKANALQDNLVENYANLGIAYARQGNAPKALEAFRKTLELNPNHPAALNGIGIEHAKKGEWDEAEKYFNKVLQMYPNHPDATNNLKRLETLKK